MRWRGEGGPAPGRCLRGEGRPAPGEMAARRGEDCTGGDGRAGPACSSAPCFAGHIGEHGSSGTDPAAAPPVLRALRVQADDGAGASACLEAEAGEERFARSFCF